MQKTILSIALAVFLALPGFSQDQKFTREEVAIREVIENESKHFWGRDYDGWQATYIHAPYVSWTAATKDGVRRYSGWESWSKQVKDLFSTDPEPQEYEGVVTKYNYKFRIYGKGAWVAFEQMDNGTKTWETRILEKEDGKWKIAMVELIFNANETALTDGDTGE